MECRRLYLIFSRECLLHLHWLLGHVGEGDLHGELDGVEQLNDHVGDHFEARLPLSAPWKMIMYRYNCCSGVRAQ